MDELRPGVREHIGTAERLPELAPGPPPAGFLDYVKAHTAPLSALLTDLKQNERCVDAFELRAGFAPPGQAVVDVSIQDLCKLPYRTSDGSVPCCPGLTRGLHGCPPHAPEVGETKALLQRAVSLLVIQFAGQEGSAPQGEIHRFMTRVSKTLSQSGYDVLVTYGSGPCKVCPKGCGDTHECRLPDRRFFALEACGFWVNAVCRAAAPYPVLEAAPQPVRWLVDWRLPTQNTTSIAYTTGVLLQG